MNLRPRNAARHGRWAFTLLELCVVAAILIVLFGALGAAYSKKRQGQLRATSRDWSRRSKCVQNLKDIGLTLRVWATDSLNGFPTEYSTNQGGTREFTNLWQHFRPLSNELSTPNILVCPGSDQKPAANFESLQDQNFSYFLGVKATEATPEAFLAGDGGFAISTNEPWSNPLPITKNSGMTYPETVHKGIGVICMGDGSIQQLSSKRLKDLLASKGQTLETNLLLLPR